MLRLTPTLAAKKTKKKTKPKHCYPNCRLCRLTTMNP